MQFQTVPVGYLSAPFDNLPFQFIIRGKGDVFLLDSGIDVNVLVINRNQKYSENGNNCIILILVDCFYLFPWKKLTPFLAYYLITLTIIYYP